MFAALNQVIKLGLADPNKISLMGGSHGGFLVAHLLGQVSAFRQVSAFSHDVTLLQREGECITGS